MGLLAYASLAQHYRLLKTQQQQQQQQKTHTKNPPTKTLNKQTKTNGIFPYSNCFLYPKQGISNYRVIEPNYDRYRCSGRISSSCSKRATLVLLLKYTNAISDGNRVDHR